MPTSTHRPLLHIQPMVALMEIRHHLKISFLTFQARTFLQRTQHLLLEEREFNQAIFQFTFSMNV